MKTRILFAVVFIGMVTIFQGCYTILDIPEGNDDGYVTTYEYVPVIIYEPIPVPPPPTYYPPTYETYQPVVTTPQTKERTNGIGNGNSTIRNDGNGRGNSGRENDFIRNNNTQTTNYSSTSNNTSSNNRDSGSSGTRNSGSGRR